MLIFKNSFEEVDLNPNGAKMIYTGEYLQKYKYEDKVKTSVVESLKLKIQIEDNKQFYPVFFVQVPIQRCEFTEFDVLEFENLKGKFVQKFGTRDVEFLGSADAVKVAKTK